MSDPTPSPSPRSGEGRKTYIIITGLGDSGPKHWQSLWQQSLPNAIRVVQRDWENPQLTDWLAALDDTLQNTEGDCILIAHSLGVALVAHWAKKFHNSKVRAALLVSPSDVDSPAHTPESVRGFAPMPLLWLPFKTLVVCSSNDPFVTPERAAFFANAWGADLENIGACGHINGDSNLGDWPQGLALLAKLAN